MVDLSQSELANKAGVSLSTVVDFERTRRVVAQQSVTALRAALEAAGIEFIDPNGGGAGVRLRAP